ncbi:MAG: RNase adapter RapZ [Firmicutes bacterium HGW-Firmicutes-13]|nr:MAG: RNase adapter RapZ [Firmicutes bacterium HGW-Firmicutes-13]
MRFVLITGLSGAGKTEAIRCFEDLGYFCVDNLPPTFIPKFAELCIHSEGKINRIALVCDIRGREFFHKLFEALDIMESEGLKYEILFLETTDEKLIRRFKETRRRHPLADHASIIEGIKKERNVLEKIKNKANLIIDTTDLTPRELKEQITVVYSKDITRENILITVVSFGFKYGIPMDADLVFDVRFLPNPHYIDSLRPLTGNDQPVKEFVWQWVITHQFFDKLKDLTTFLIPHYIKEGKVQLVIAVGCTGGKHRSVAVSAELYNYLKQNNYQLVLEHRDISKS